MAVTVTKNVDIYLNALDRTILYNGIRKQISDSYWETNITPLLYDISVYKLNYIFYIRFKLIF